MKETTRACIHSPVPENGNWKIKTKREYVRNGPFHSSPVQLLFNTCSPPFIKKQRAPVVRIERRNFFLMPTVCLRAKWVQYVKTRVVWLYKKCQNNIGLLRTIVFHPSLPLLFLVYCAIHTLHILSLLLCCFKLITPLQKYVFEYKLIQVHYCNYALLKILIFAMQRKF